jgi:predicted RNA-binding protein
MCQAAVYLDGEKILDDVLIVEPLPEGVRLVKLFEPDHLVPAIIRKIDLMKNQVILETQPEADHTRDEK